jgi:hypothetical protein
MVVHDQPPPVRLPQEGHAEAGGGVEGGTVLPDAMEIVAPGTDRHIAEDAGGMLAEFGRTAP